MNKYIIITLCTITAISFILSTKNTSVQTEVKADIPTQKKVKHNTSKREHHKRKQASISELDKAYNDVDTLQLPKDFKDLDFSSQNDEKTHLFFEEIFLLMEKHQALVKNLAHSNFNKLTLKEKEILWSLLQTPEMQKIMTLSNRISTLDKPSSVSVELRKIYALNKLFRNSIQLMSEFQSDDEAFIYLGASFKISQLTKNKPDTDLQNFDIIPQNLNSENREKLYKLLQNNYYYHKDEHLDSIDSERVVMDSYFQQIASSLLKEAPNSPNYTTEKDHAYYIKALVNLREIASQDYHQAQYDIAHWGQKLKADSQHYPVSHMLLQQLPSTLAHSQEIITRNQMEIIKIKTQLYEAQHHKAPTSLDDLQLDQEIIYDQLSGKKFIYEYSNGKTKISSHGKIKGSQPSIEF